MKTTTKPRRIYGLRMHSTMTDETYYYLHSDLGVLNDFLRLWKDYVFGESTEEKCQRIDDCILDNGIIEASEATHDLDEHVAKDGRTYITADDGKRYAVAVMYRNSTRF